MTMAVETDWGADGANGDSLGYSVSLSSDGSIVTGSIWAIQTTKFILLQVMLVA